MKIWIYILFLILGAVQLSGQNKFSFVFLPDLHLQPDSAIEADFNLLAKQINKIHPDFILTGGDMIYTAKNGDEKKAEILFDFMASELGKFKMPVYYTMGNHEVVGILPDSGIESSHPQWGKRMYEQRYGKRYKSFEYSGWKFFLLDGIKILEEKMNYTSGVDNEQMDWIKSELENLPANVPIIVSIHTPLVNPKAFIDSGIPALSENAKAVLDLFEGHNLKMVLQGHNHVYMNLMFRGVHYVSGGSTSYSDDLKHFDDGFIQVRIKGNQEETEFISTRRLESVDN